MRRLAYGRSEIDLIARHNAGESRAMGEADRWQGRGEQSRAERWEGGPMAGQGQALPVHFSDGRA